MRSNDAERATRSGSRVDKPRNRVPIDKPSTERRRSRKHGVSTDLVVFINSLAWGSTHDEFNLLCPTCFFAASDYSLATNLQYGPVIIFKTPYCMGLVARVDQAI